MKKYKFIYPHDLSTTVQHILKDTHKPHNIQEEVIYAKLSKNGKSICMFHGTLYKNAFLPILQLKLIEKNKNQTVAKGFWRWSAFVSILYLWIGICLITGLVDGFLSENNMQIGVLAILGLIYILLCIFCVLLERKHMKKIIEHLESIQ